MAYGLFVPEIDHVSAHIGPWLPEHGGDDDVDHDEDRVRDVVAGRTVLLRLDQRLGEPGVGEHVPDGDQQQDHGVLAFELHAGSLQTGRVLAGVRRAGG